MIDEFLEKSKNDDGMSAVLLEYDLAFNLHRKSVVVSKEVSTLLQLNIQMRQYLEGALYKTILILLKN
jgi:hypothetical protein